MHFICYITTGDIDSLIACLVEFLYKVVFSSLPPLYSLFCRDSYIYIAELLAQQRENPNVKVQLDTEELHRRSNERLREKYEAREPESKTGVGIMLLGSVFFGIGTIIIKLGIL
jgi:hypothetical protein